MYFSKSVIIKTGYYTPCFLADEKSCFHFTFLKHLRQSLWELSPLQYAKEPEPRVINGGGGDGFHI